MMTRFTHKPPGHPEIIGSTGKQDHWSTEAKCLQGSFGPAPWPHGPTAEDLPTETGTGIGSQRGTKFELTPGFSQSLGPSEIWG